MGLLLIVGALVFLTRAALAPRTPPDIVVRVDSVSALSAGYLVHFTARNRGSETASAVQVEGVLSPPPGGGGDTLRSDITLDYVPGRSTRGGGVYFARDPRQGRLELRARGYASP